MKGGSIIKAARGGFDAEKICDNLSKLGHLEEDPSTALELHELLVIYRGWCKVSLERDTLKCFPAICRLRLLGFMCILKWY